MHSRWNLISVSLYSAFIHSIYLLVLIEIFLIEEKKKTPKKQSIPASWFFYLYSKWFSWIEQFFFVTFYINWSPFHHLHLVSEGPMHNPSEVNFWKHTVLFNSSDWLSYMDNIGEFPIWKIYWSFPKKLCLLISLGTWACVFLILCADIEFPSLFKLRWEIVQTFREPALCISLDYDCSVLLDSRSQPDIWHLSKISWKSENVQLLKEVVSKYWCILYISKKRRHCIRTNQPSLNLFQNLATILGLVI